MAAESPSTAACSAAHSEPPARQSLSAASDSTNRPSAAKRDSCASCSAARVSLAALAASAALGAVPPASAWPPLPLPPPSAPLAAVAAGVAAAEVAGVVVVAVVVLVVDVVGAHARSVVFVAGRVSCCPDSSHGADTGWHEPSTSALNPTPASQPLQVWSELVVAAMSRSCPAVHRVTFMQEDQPRPQVPVGHGEPANIWRRQTHGTPK